MRNLIIALTCSLALGAVSVNLSDAAQKGKNQTQQSQKKQKKGGKSGKGKGGQGRNDPSTIAARMIQQYDRNGDKALNLQELSEALTAMQERRSQNRGADKGGKGKSGKGKGGKGKGGKGK